MNLCDMTTIRELMGRHGFHFSKSLGQNFLTEDWVPERIAAECGADMESGVLEIGPGIGCLTVALAKRAQRVVSVELDRALLPVLEETLADEDNVLIVQGDVMKINLRALCQEKLGSLPVHACANLPYYITTPVIALLLESGLFESITVMVQKEVAQRICAAPGTREYGAFSVYTQYYADPAILFEISRGCFVPQPKVDSAVLRLLPRRTPPVKVSDEKLFFAIVRASFGQRRKTLCNAVGSAFGGRLNKAQITSLIESCGFDARIRGEKLSLANFAALTNVADALLRSDAEKEQNADQQ